MTNPTLQITTVVFDLGNVVIHWDPYLPLADEMTREEWRELAEAVGFDALNRRGDAGMSIDEFLAEADKKGPQHRAWLTKYFEGFVRALSGPVDGTAEIIRELQTTDVRLLGLTNWAAETFPNAQTVVPVIGELEGILVSGEVGLAKPDPKIFELMIQTYNIDPEKTIFVDDAAANVAAAAALGFQAVQFIDAEQFRSVLVDYGVLH